MSVSIDPERTEVAVIHRLIDFSGRSVLEIGCGDGRLTWRYADQADRVLAIDPDPDEVEIAQENLPDSLRETVEFRVADITADRLPNRQFDLAVLSYSL